MVRYQTFLILIFFDSMFKTRSQKLERIDTGDYTAEEYELFLKDIRLVNRFAGDNRALRKTLLADIIATEKNSLSVLDVGAGSGELLRTIAKFARQKKLNFNLTGLELNPRSAESILEESKDFTEIKGVRGDALMLPFEDDSFDYSISSLFTHHLTKSQILTSLSEMSRVSRRKIFVIDLHRNPAAYGLYKAFCTAFRISRMVREDGSLSILRGFKAKELSDLGKESGLRNVKVSKSFPSRLVLSGE